MLSEQEQGELSNLALKMAPGQDMHLAALLYRELYSDFEREAAMEKVLDRQAEEWSGEDPGDGIYDEA